MINIKISILEIKVNFNDIENISFEEREVT